MKLEPHLELWQALYQASDYATLVRFFCTVGDRWRPVKLTLERYVSPFVPGWQRIAQRHFESYRRFVTHWIQGSLDDEDWKRAEQWARQRRMSVLAWLLTGLARGEWSWDSFLVNEAKKGPRRIFEEAYRQVLALIEQERQGLLPFPPRFCEQCQAPYLPTRSAGRFCSPRCTNRHWVRLHRFRPQTQTTDGQEAEKTGSAAQG
jgi:hypothetical protein